jgi:hypothetical protein
MKFENIKTYLPKFLSAESDKELFAGLKEFPDNLDSRFYTKHLTDTETVYQGDGINDMLVVNLPEAVSKKAPCIILSNTCDIHLDNTRNFPSRIVYAPIFNLRKYKDSLYSLSKKTPEQINDHIFSIKRQEITQIFYLPENKDGMKESIVFFDRLNNCPNSFFDSKEVKSRRIFTLSDYGYYLFLLKLSIHFTRIQDRVERKSTRI